MPSTPAFARRLALAAASILVSGAAFAAVAVPPGFEVDVVADNLTFVTAIAFDGDGVLHAAEANLFAGTGRVLRLEDTDGDGVTETVTEYRAGFGLSTGIAFRADAFPPRPPRGPRAATSVPHLERIRRGDFQGQALDLFVTHFVPGVTGSGTLSVVRDRDRDGVAEERADVVTGLPADGANGTQQIAVGFDGRLHFGLGGRTNSGVPGPGQPPDTPLNGTILRVSPDGSDLAVHAEGLRNAFDLLFTPGGELLATENGPDASGPNPVFDAPDELNAILEGGDYGWPDHVGFPPEGTGTLGPIALFGSGTSTDGIALMTVPFCGFEEQIFAAQFGSFTNPAVGRRLLRLRLVGQRGILVDEFATGFGRPLDVAVAPDGSLYVADFSDVFLTPGSGVIYRIRPTCLP